MFQLVDLRVYFLVYGFIAVAHAHRNDAAEEVEILVAVRIPDVLIFRVRDDQRFFEVMEDRREKKLPLGEKDFLFRHGRSYYRATRPMQSGLKCSKIRHEVCDWL